MHSHARWLVSTALFLALAIPVSTADKPADPVPNRPKVAGKLKLQLRERKEAAPGAKEVKAVERTVEWNAAETCVIICDMWDDHYCKSAAQRVGVMVPAMNRVVSEARNHGVMILHCPSDTIHLYADYPQRKRMIEAKAAKPPTPIERWCYLDKTREPEMPVDTAKCACDDAILGSVVRKHTRQHPGLDIAGFDGISESGQEIYNWMEQEGIKNVAIVGVHTNMCVLGRSFGIRQMTRLGKNVVLIRDLTDAMYDPRQPPFVSHARGTELVVEHIERFWCPSILSDDLTKVVEGSAGPTSK